MATSNMPIPTVAAMTWVQRGVPEFEEWVPVLPMALRSQPVSLQSFPSPRSTVQQEEMRTGIGKIVSIAKVREALAAWRRQGGAELVWIGH